jgi:phage-related protein
MSAAAVRHSQPREKSDRLVAKYYRLADGTMPVREFIDELPEAQQVLIENFIDRINTLCTVQNPHLPAPDSLQIEGELRELRPTARGNHYRILYCRSDRMVILLHIFRKKTDKTPEAEKRTARNRWADFQARMDADPRVQPSSIAPRNAP